MPGKIGGDDVAGDHSDLVLPRFPLPIEKPHRGIIHLDGTSEHQHRHLGVCGRASPQATAQLSQVLQALANPQAIPGVDPQAALNHLWVYIDRV